MFWVKIRDRIGCWMQSLRRGKRRRNWLPDAVVTGVQQSLQDQSLRGSRRLLRFGYWLVNPGGQQPPQTRLWEATEVLLKKAGSCRRSLRKARSLDKRACASLNARDSFVFSYTNSVW